MLQQEIYKHFHPDEHHFVDKAWDWFIRASEYHTSKLTDFLDPRQVSIMSSLAGKHLEAKVHVFGGHELAERKRAWIAPDYMVSSEEGFQLSVLVITSEDTQFSKLSHGDFLGSLLGLGLKRDKIGDIYVLEKLCHCVIASEIADYIRLQLQQVSRVHVHTELVPLAQLETAAQSLEEMSISVASMRMDGIVSDVIRVSRAKVLPPIKNGRCKVNWKVEEDPSRMLKEGDVISFQGFGRFRILEAQGETKKGRIRLKVGKYV